jgi:hypothetical protein
MLNFKEFMVVDPVAAYDEHLRQIENHLNKQHDDYAPDIAWEMLIQREPSPANSDQFRKLNELKRWARTLRSSFLRGLNTDTDNF